MYNPIHTEAFTGEVTMNRLSRSTALKIAAILSLAFSIFAVIYAIPNLIQGEQLVNQSGDAPPYFVIVLGFMLAIVRIIAAYGTWHNQRWGIVLILLATALDTVAAVPGIFFAPTTYLWVAATVGTVSGIVIIVLCLWRDPKPVTVQS
jgi:uncharacterized membrane protein (DUF2068 family)